MDASQVMKLGRPDSDSFEFLNQWLKGEDEGNNFLKRAEVDTWRNRHDLVSLHVREPEDAPLFPWLTDGLLGAYHATFGRLNAEV